MNVYDDGSILTRAEFECLGYDDAAAAADVSRADYLDLYELLLLRTNIAVEVNKYHNTRSTIVLLLHF